ncbi:cytochrome P450 [Aspergillus mulundensis]|uniref:Cytochrome P450 n=1 Tax=Aspergillus mulundensis TaxID=1810919 RepID=A0A3D8RY01_9EURO|nr:Cytochrome P450 [Aspergillus mulundensis]RDW78939.1 Cytochrome P450 [Aspergillus mulundensis]
MALATDLDLWHVAAALAVLYAGKCLRDIYWHPLSQFPGPILVLLGPFYEFYYDVIKDGTFLWEIEKMHQKYGTGASVPPYACTSSEDIRTLTTPPGPIVRINKRELHIRDSDFYSQIYAGNSRRIDKDAPTVQAFAVPTSVAATVDHHHHRARRGYLNPYFSKRSIGDLEPIIHERVDRLCGRFNEALQTHEVVNLDSAFSALTADIITSRLYGAHFDYLGIPDFKFAVRETFEGMSLVFHLSRFIPFMMATLKLLPLAAIRLIMPSAADLLQIREGIKRNILSTLDSSNGGGEGERHSRSRAVIAAALRDPEIPLEERRIERLMDEGTTIIFAGTETSARAMSVAFFHLLSNQAHLETLRAELRSRLGSRPGNGWALADLESLPFLTGVVNECLRLSFGAVGRLPRVATHDALQYKEYSIPAGTPVSQSTYFVHTNPAVYPDPFAFDPERWVRAAKDGVPLGKHLVSFTKGTRQCLGMNMALAELYIAIARIAQAFDMRLHNTTQDDIEVHHVRLVGYPRKIRGQVAGRGQVEVKVTVNRDVDMEAEA